MSRIEDALAKANLLRQSKINNGKGPDTAHPPPCGSRKWNRRWCLGVGISLALAVGFSVYRIAEVAFIPSRPKLPAIEVSGTPLPAVQQPAIAKSSPQKNRLPTSIPLNSLDAAYSSAHPGWQRYETESLEFRVFQEENAIKAVQVISRQGKSITVDYFTSFLVEIAGRDTFKVKSKEDRDGFYIEKGTAGDMAEVVVYHKKSTGEISAIVVAYL